MGMAVSEKTFNYVSPVVNGKLPVGFNGLIGSGGFATQPAAWEEVKYECAMDMDSPGCSGGGS